MNGVAMPRVGLGTWPVTDRDDCVRMVRAGLEAGFRHVDTARMYDNEAHVGEAIETATVPREGLFDAPLLAEIAAAYGVSEAELTIAWLCSKERVFPIPKSTNPDHLRANAAAQSLSIDAADLDRIDSLDEWRQQRVNDPDNPARRWQLTDD